MTFDPDDDSIIHLLHKGKPVSFELDKVFSPRASQLDVSMAVWGKEERAGDRWRQRLTRGRWWGTWTEREGSRG